jgi:hypothetical protein
MPPELIVTSAQVQVTNIETNENMPEKQAEVAVTREPQYQQAEKTRQHKSSQMSFGYVAHVPVHYVMVSQTVGHRDSPGDLDLPKVGTPSSQELF